MPQVNLNDDLYSRVAQFKQVVEQIIEQKISFNDCVALIIGQGIDSMLRDILGHVDQLTLLTSFEQLGARNPAQVYGYVAETLRRGAAVRERETLKRKLGFYQPARRRKRRPN